MPKRILCHAKTRGSHHLCRLLGTITTEIWTWGNHVCDSHDLRMSQDWGRETEEFSSQENSSSLSLLPERRYCVRACGENAHICLFSLENVGSTLTEDMKMKHIGDNMPNCLSRNKAWSSLSVEGRGGKKRGAFKVVPENNFLGLPCLPSWLCTEAEPLAQCVPLPCPGEGLFATHWGKARGLFKGKVKGSAVSNPGPSTKFQKAPRLSCRGVPRWPQRPFQNTDGILCAVSIQTQGTRRSFARIWTCS